jgi:hypothetical protein
MILVIPWLGLSKGQIAGFTTALIIAGEVLFYLSIFILGKPFLEKIKSRLKFRKPRSKDMESPEQISK